MAAGAWTPELLAPLGLELPVEPRRGQIVRWQLPEPLFQRVINEGPRYLVSRPDGHLLAGSTVEDVGFQDNTTDEGVAELVHFAHSLVPQLQEVRPVDQWAGLRPASLDGKPYLGPVPGHPRISVATGHFRSGIHLAPATARLLRQLICGQATDLDLSLVFADAIDGSRSGSMAFHSRRQMRRDEFGQRGITACPLSADARSGIITARDRRRSGAFGLSHGRWTATISSPLSKVT